ncbi:hypothetical protein SAMN05216327_103107 [Dyadobacter sp. SG02]|uniref:DUF6934 family protein n=1 Tax=Dyadobacter sp. SG02 TaxID=1855291 RepID=UPI0008C4F46E|nr:hypothetical protein [Dyadobacter sp. SG02]SEI66020.1 hypothetical protein SAMN05216327_103107 [Dyadobacter sp. SG02]
MQSEFYPFQSDNDQLYFEFVSVSFERTIRKAVLFTEFPHSNGLFNLALLDVLPNGELSDIASPENNLDLEKVMSTVSECLRIFLERYPYAEIKIQGNTPAKSRLYRMVLGKELSNIQKYYEIYGDSGTVVEPFELNKTYQVYILKLRQR